MSSESAVGVGQFFCAVGVGVQDGVSDGRVEDREGAVVVGRVAVCVFGVAVCTFGVAVCMFGVAVCVLWVAVCTCAGTVVVFVCCCPGL